jgi:hypothetical protein
MMGEAASRKTTAIKLKPAGIQCMQQKRRVRLLPKFTNRRRFSGAGKRKPRLAWFFPPSCQKKSLLNLVMGFIGQFGEGGEMLASARQGCQICTNFAIMPFGKNLELKSIL